MRGGEEFRLAAQAAREDAEAGGEAFLPRVGLVRAACGAAAAAGRAARVRAVTRVCGVFAAWCAAAFARVMFHAAEGFVREAVEELAEGFFRARGDGLHVADFLEGGVGADGVVDVEGVFFDGGAEARGAAEHLLEEDAGFHAAQEDERRDLGDVDAGREEVDGDDDARVLLVLEVLDGFADFLLAAVLDGAGDFPDGGGGGLSLVDLAQQAHDEVGVLVVLGEDEHFPLLARRGVEVFRDLF